jgi:energy-coupling factor transport system ATP-binding protein
MRVADVAQRVGMVFQDFESQLFSTNALLEVAFGMENLGMDREEMRQRIADMLRLVGLQGHEDRDPATLSGGEKQRLAIASVLAMRPDILIMDEPTTDLDPQGKREIFKVLSALRSSGATVLLVEHELAAAEMSDRVLVLKDGQVGADVPPMDLLRQPSFMEKMSIRPSEVERLFAALQLGPAKNLSMEETASVLQARGFVPQPENCRTFVQKQARPQVAGSHTMIEVESLTHTYPSGLQALKSVNWRVAEGEFLAIVGANGSGKTTLVKHLNGLLRPTAGRVLLKGQDIAGRTVPSLGREVGYCFQNPDHQIFSNTVREEVAFGPRNFGMSKTELAQNVADAIKTVGLEGREESDPFALTKGERQRVAVASILAARPPVIVLDEPTTGLDYAEQRRMMDLVARLNKEGHTIIIITHSMWVVAEYAPRTVVMTGGEIIADGPTREVFSKADVLARANLLPPRLARLTQKWGFTLFTAKEYLECLNRPEPRTLNPEP